jgi:hypothetical protein
MSLKASNWLVFVFLCPIFYPETKVGEEDERGGKQKELRSGCSFRVLLFLNKVETLARRLIGWLDSDASFFFSWWLSGPLYFVALVMHNSDCNTVQHHSQNCVI